MVEQVSFHLFTSVYHVYNDCFMIKRLYEHEMCDAVYVDIVPSDVRRVLRVFTGV